MASPLGVADLVESFRTVATADPLSALLLVVGAVLVGVSAGGFGILALGGLVDAIVPDELGREPPREA
ncbi:MAG: hypothetical protein ABEJ68_10560 [Halobacteriaceae archaeon]